MKQKSMALPRLTEQECKCCKEWKLCGLYILQNGLAEFVCKECRKGK